MKKETINGETESDAPGSLQRLVRHQRTEFMTNLWKHMAETHGVHLLESEENDIRWAANEDAEKERIRMVNQLTETITENLRLKKLSPAKRSVAAMPNATKLSHERITQYAHGFGGMNSDSPIHPINLTRSSLAPARLLEWLGDKLKGAEKELTAREQSVTAWRGGTDKSWAKSGCYMPKGQRLKQAETHERIAVKTRREVSNFKEVIEILSHSNTELSRNAPTES